MILAITGAPRTGKSYLAEHLALTSGTPLLRTDDITRTFRSLPASEGWSLVSKTVAARMLTARHDLIAEGVAIPRALRKMLALWNGRPCDRLVVLLDRRPEGGPVLDGQVAMGKGVATVLREIWGELRKRGVEIVDGNGRPLAVGDLG